MTEKNRSARIWDAFIVIADGHSHSGEIFSTREAAKLRAQSINEEVVKVEIREIKAP